jgi:quercetin dioxygenase-like cupin family protein
MNGRFLIESEVEPQKLEWGSLRWLSTPKVTGADELTVIQVTLEPGKGHDFHKHPDQEEVIHVIGGKVEQWIDQQRHNLGPNDSAFIPADTVHASFNAGDEPAKLLAILGPCVGENGYELVDVSEQAPWSGLRKG